MTQYSRSTQDLINRNEAVPLYIDGTNECPNCKGAKTVFAYKIISGPYRSPNGKCKWLDFDDESKSGWYSGETIEENCPVCTQGRVIDWLKSNCGLTGFCLSKSLENFNVNGLLEDKKAALDAAKLNLSANESCHGLLTFYGSFGVGKTHLLMSLVNGFTSIRVRAVYSLASDILDDIRSGYQNRTNDFLSQYQNIRVLCIDEIDKVSLTDWALQTFHQLVDHRYRNSEKYLTVFSSNLSPFQYPQELHYLSSRMTAGSVVEVKGADMRPVVDTYTDI